MTVELVIVFLGVCLLAYVTPGPDWFVIMRYTALSRRSGFISALGVQTGLAAHIIAAALGVTAVILAGDTAFAILKFAGAGYLVFLGVQSLLKARRVRKRDEESDMASEHGAPGIFWKSLLANVLNPQAAIFFVAVLPQFIDPSSSLLRQIAILGALDIALGILWWLIYIYAIGLVRRFLGASRAQRVLNIVAGLVLVVLGLVLALTDPSA